MMSQIDPKQHSVRSVLLATHSSDKDLKMAIWAGYKCFSRMLNFRYKKSNMINIKYNYIKTDPSNYVFGWTTYLIFFRNVLSIKF